MDLLKQGKNNNFQKHVFW